MLVLIQNVQFELEEQSIGGRRLSDARGRTDEQDEGNYMRRFIICNLPTTKKKRYNGEYYNCVIACIWKTLSKEDGSSLIMYEVPSKTECTHKGSSYTGMKHSVKILMDSYNSA
jgi:hypothetical protein